MAEKEKNRINKISEKKKTPGEIKEKKRNTREQNKTGQKKTLRVPVVAAGVLAAAIVGIAAWLGISYIGKDSTYAAQGEAVSTDTISADSVSVSNLTEQYMDAWNQLDYREIASMNDFADEKWNEGMLLFAGKLYKYREDQQIYLFMGVDNDHMVSKAEDGLEGGQSDAMFLVVTDGKGEKIRTVAINRNTMVPVEVYDSDGNYVTTRDLQICVQHGFGDGMKLSCMRSVDAVKRLFGNIPITGYLALNMGGVPAMNDAVGGVELTPIQSIDWNNAGIVEGQPVKLNGEQAYAYLRYRDTDEFASADKRLERQKQYVTAIIDKVLKDPGLATKIVDSTSDYIVASIDLGRLANSAKDMSFDPDNVYTVPGETTLEGEYECYHPDELGMIQLILDVFYEEVG